jgi:predicted esterase
VPGFELDLSSPLPRAALAHGALDPVISVDWSRQAYERLRAADADVVSAESPHMAHSIDPDVLRWLPGWISETVGGAA